MQDLTGKTVGMLTVLKRSDRDDIKGGRWICQCSCEKQTIAHVAHWKLSAGTQKSCGCLREKSQFQVTHGMNGTRTHKSWMSMKERSLNPNYYQFDKYGGRGIRICAELMKFEGFFSLMGERPAGRTLDRIDNDLHYSCGSCDQCREMGWMMNCRWATPKMQRDNNRNCYMVEINGEKKSRLDWCRDSRIPYVTIRKWMDRGLTAKEAILARMKSNRFPSAPNTSHGTPASCRASRPQP